MLSSVSIRIRKFIHVCIGVCMQVLDRREVRLLTTEVTHRQLHIVRG
jgi:hypothetical protein